MNDWLVGIILIPLLLGAICVYPPILGAIVFFIFVALLVGLFSGIYNRLK